MSTKIDPIDALTILIEIEPVIDDRLLDALNKRLGKSPRMILAVSSPGRESTLFEEIKTQNVLRDFVDHPNVKPQLTWESLARLAVERESAIK